MRDGFDRSWTCLLCLPEPDAQGALSHLFAWPSVRQPPADASSCAWQAAARCCLLLGDDTMVVRPDHAGAEGHVQPSFSHTAGQLGPGSLDQRLAAPGSAGKLQPTASGQPLPASAA